MNRRVTDRPASSFHPAVGYSMRKLYALLVLTFVVICGAGYYLYSAGVLAPEPILDHQTLCPRDKPTVSATYLLVDVTDPPSKADILRLREAALSAALAMPDYALFVIAVLNPDDAASPEIAFRRCTPLSPVRTSILRGGTQYLRTAWKKKFEAPMLEALDQTTSSTLKAARSPIIATIAALTQRPDFSGKVKDRQLVLFSDLLEFNRGGYSQLQRGDIMAMFRRSSLSQTWPDLKSVPVTVVYISRNEPAFMRAQVPAHRSFWNWYLTTAGASHVEFIGVQEAPPALPAEPAPKPPRPALAPRHQFRNSCNCGGS
ncbi:hypothetical protein QWJ07_24495 [Frankia sp. RB7]|nr:hypothetical protein [Frankia sp. RB7]